MDGPLFSVLMANYNNGKFIQDAINSVLDQTYHHFELIIVDDASTDDSEGIIQSYLAKTDRISLYRNKENLGCGGAKRKAALLAKGDILGFLDPDDVLMPEAIEMMVKEHAKNPECSVINSSHWVCDEDLQVLREAYGAMEIPRGESYLSFGKGITQFASFRKSYYQRTAGIDGSFKRAVDQDLYYKLEEAGSVKFINDPLYKYRLHSNGISSFGNLSKSRYWFVRAKENAYVRRKSASAGAKNIDQKELNAWWGILYVSKSSDAFRKWNVCKGVYWLGRSILKSPFDKYLLLKVKSLFLGSVFHKLYRKAAH